mmetsp:Transcript_10333/g.19016  ORF Transcript_10333/g.19016 Transcript_10333/m.19016 type:complete len:148 (-) Transcript_10333:145-588(-)
MGCVVSARQQGREVSKVQQNLKMRFLTSFYGYESTGTTASTVSSRVVSIDLATPSKEIRQVGKLPQDKGKVKIEGNGTDNQFQDKLSDMRKNHDWDEIPMDFFVDDFVEDFSEIDSERSSLRRLGGFNEPRYHPENASFLDVSKELK